MFFLSFEGNEIKEEFLYKEVFNFSFCIVVEKDEEDVCNLLEELENVKENW